MKKSILAALLTGTLCATLAVPAGAQSTSTGATYCPVHVEAYATNDPSQLAFAVWSDDVAGTASGSITAYVNGNKYAIPFANVTAPDERNRSAVPQPVVVNFGAPAHFDSAYVGSLSGGDCAVHEPFVQQPLKATLPLTAAIAAPAAAPEEALACAVPYAPASRTNSIAPVYPDSTVLFNGNVNVKLALDADGKVIAMRMQKASQRMEPYDHAAAFAAAGSTYSPEIYRCQPVSTDFNLAVNFAPYISDGHSLAFMMPHPSSTLTGYSNGPASATSFR